MTVSVLGEGDCQLSSVALFDYVINVYKSNILFTSVSLCPAKFTPPPHHSSTPLLQLAPTTHSPL